MELKKESSKAKRNSEEIIDLAISDEVNMIYPNFANTPSKTDTTQKLLKISKVYSMPIYSDIVETNQDIDLINIYVDFDVSTKTHQRLPYLLPPASKAGMILSALMQKYA